MGFTVVTAFFDSIQCLRPHMGNLANSVPQSACIFATFFSVEDSRVKIHSCAFSLASVLPLMGIAVQYREWSSIMVRI